MNERLEGLSPRVAVRLDGVGKVFSRRGHDGTDLVALDRVDLQVMEGEIVGVVGPNGSGKSTLLKVVAGVTAPTTGTARRRGRVAPVLELGTGVHPDLTGRENAALLCSLLEEARRPTADHVNQIIEFAGLEQHVDRPVRFYSTGMLARLAFSVAVHSDASLLLIDEVLSVGDLDFQDRGRARIRELNSNGTTVLLVTHDLSLVTEMCHSAVLLVEGRVEMVGDAESVIDSYVGRPRAITDAGPIELRVDRTGLSPDGVLTVHMNLPEGAGSTCVRFDYITQAPALFELVEQSSSLVCATSTIEVVGHGPIRFELSTLGLPRGTYQLHATVEDEDGGSSLFGAVPFDVESARGGYLLDVPTSLSVDRRAVEAT